MNGRGQMTQQWKVECLLCDARAIISGGKWDSKSEFKRIGWTFQVNCWVCPRCNRQYDATNHLISGIESALKAKATGA